MTDTGVLDNFRPVSLKQLDALALMNRTDTKFLFRADRLSDFLHQLQPYYQLLEINGTRIMPYRSVYFDTPDYFLYRCHHNGVRSRYKVRLRDYLISDRSFFEIKRKTNKDKTKKKRIEVPYQTGEISSESRLFLDANSPLGQYRLVKTLENSFSRLTLAGFDSRERITIDLNVNFRVGDQILDMSRLVIAEVKQSGHQGSSPVMKVLHRMDVQAGSFSKYCMGIVSMVEGVKYNNFKPKLRNVKKILE